MNNYCVYELIDGRNNEVFYVGKGQIVDYAKRRYRRIKDHLNLNDVYNKFKVNIINKIRKSGQEVKFNIVVDNISEEEALNTEKILIKKYGKRIDKTGTLVNLTDGGEGISGFRHSERTKQKMSYIRKKYYENHAPNFKGKKHSPESRLLMSMKQREFLRKNPSPSLGRKHSEKTKQKLSEIRKGRKWPKEICYKFANKGEKNGQAKEYIFVSPEGKQFKIKGIFKKFVKDNALSLDICKDYINKGKIPEPKNPNHNRVTEQRKNASNWEIKKT